MLSLLSYLLYWVNYFHLIHQITVSQYWILGINIFTNKDMNFVFGSTDITFEFIPKPSNYIKNKFYFY